MIPDVGDRKSHEVKGDTRAKTARASSISKRIVFRHDPFEMRNNRYECEKQGLKWIWVGV